MDIITGGGSSLTGSTIDPSYIVTALNGTNVTLTADDSITVTNAINASGNGSAGNLTLNAPTDYLNAPITLQGSSTLSGSATTVNVGANGLVQNGVDAAAAGATVTLAAATYDLTSEITIGKDLTLNGQTASSTILNGQNQTRVMEIDGTNSGITVNITGVTIENGNGSGTNDSAVGGGVLVYAENGTHAIVNINNNTILDNSTADAGGGVFNDGGFSGTAILNINDSTITGNSVGGSMYPTGGGIFNSGHDGGAATMNINSSTISDNSANGNDGGGIFNGSSNSGNAIMTITNSTIIGNAAIGSGGGVGGTGGGIQNDSRSGSTTMTISGSTISGNSSSVDGGGIENYNSSLTISDTILSGNAVSAESDYHSDSGTLTSNGYNLFGQNGNNGGFVPNNTPAAPDIPLTGGICTALYCGGGSTPVLANNGGPTETIALVSGSPAIAAGGSNVGGYEIDQRGMARALSGEISIGAYEYDSRGDPFVVTSTGDTSGTNLGQLRTALNYANNNPSFDPTITFDPTDFASAQTITLTQGELVINSSLTLTGSSAGVTLNANNASRVMEIDGTPSGITVNLSNLTLTGGNGTGTNDNNSGGGLVIYAESANTATVTVADSIVSGNASVLGGGGIYNDGNFGGNAMLTITNSTIAGNHSSTDYGGGFYNAGYSGSATLTIANSTISGNSDVNGGGGIFNFGNAALTIRDTILAGNTQGGSESDYYNAGATLTSDGYNLFGQNGNSGGFTGNGTTDIQLAGSISTVLAPLGNYGGPTETMALVVGSPAYLAGGPVGSVTTDQRGDARGSTISIGAWDLNYRPSSLVVNTTSDATGDIIGGSTMSLRDALYYSNVGVISDPTITFNPTEFSTPQTITLAQGELTIDSSLTLTGSSAGVTLNANNASRVMEIDGTSSGVTVNLSNLTMENGNGSGTNNTGNGGGLLVYAESGNHATVNISNSVISGNTPSSQGGGIFNDGYNSGNAALAITNSTISSNSATNGGGGIFNDGYDNGNAALMISNSTLSGNSAPNGYGGALYNEANSGAATVTIINSTIVNNSSIGKR